MRGTGDEQGGDRLSVRYLLSCPEGDRLGSIATVPDRWVGTGARWRVLARQPDGGLRTGRAPRSPRTFVSGAPRPRLGACARLARGGRREPRSAHVELGTVLLGAAGVGGVVT